MLRRFKHLFNANGRDPYSPSRHKLRRRQHPRSKPAMHRPCTHLKVRSSLRYAHPIPIKHPCRHAYVFPPMSTNVNRCAGRETLIPHLFSPGCPVRALSWVQAVVMFSWGCGRRRGYEAPGEATGGGWPAVKGDRMLDWREVVLTWATRWLGPFNRPTLGNMGIHHIYGGGGNK